MISGGEKRERNKRERETEFSIETRELAKISISCGKRTSIGGNINYWTLDSS